MSWLRVSRQHTCPICDKPDWCSYSDDGQVVCCMRRESEQPANNGGWLHRLTEEIPATQWRSVSRVSEVPAIDMGALARRCHLAITRKQLGDLSKRLGVSGTSLKRLGTGWSDKRAYTFPMRFPSGKVSGIRYRTPSGRKYSQTGSTDGMFFNPRELSSVYLVIVEGASDAAALMDLGFHAVVGRSNCRGNVTQIQTLVEHYRPKRVAIIPDNDEPGLKGAEALLDALDSKAEILRLPDGVKDVRACIQDTKNAERLGDQLGKFFNGGHAEKGVSGDQSRQSTATQL